MGIFHKSSPGVGGEERMTMGLPLKLLPDQSLGRKFAEKIPTEKTPITRSIGKDIFETVDVSVGIGLDCICTP